MASKRDAIDCFFETLDVELRSGNSAENALTEAAKSYAEFLDYPVQVEDGPVTNEVSRSQLDKEFVDLTEPLIAWVAKRGHPHAKIIIDSASAELLEGRQAFSTDKYIPD